MRKVYLVALVCVLALMLGGVATAQERATLLLKSGERVTGQLVDMGGSDFTMQVNGKERRLPIGDVVVVDFTGNAQNLPAGEVNRVKPGQNVLVTRGGEVVEGKLYDVGGKKPLRITFNTSGQQRDFSSNQIARIYTGRPTGEVATSGSGQAAGPGGRTIQVPANQQWVATGITVQKGQMVGFSTNGQVRLGPNQDDLVGVNGKSGAYAPRATAPRVLLGGLIGRVGNGQPFGIGSQNAVPMPESGELYLGVNDNSFQDNSGAYTVTVNLSPGAAGRAVPRRR